MPTILLAQGYYYSQFGVVAFRLFANCDDSTPVSRPPPIVRKPFHGYSGGVCVRTPVEDVRQMMYGNRLIQATRQRAEETFFANIHEKRKTVEGCIATGYADRVFPGDSFRIECAGKHVDVKVLSMVKYMSFREMLQFEGVQNCLPDCSNIDAGVAIYHRFQHYEKLALQFGVIAYRFTPDFNEATREAQPVLALRTGKLTPVLTKQEIGIMSTGDSGGKQPERQVVSNKVDASQPATTTTQADVNPNEVNKRSLAEDRSVKECCKRCRICSSIRNGA